MARQNDHTRAEELISAYLDKRVSAEEKDFFERHIASCAGCRAQLEATQSMVVALRAMPVMKAPRSFVLPREMARPPRRSFLSLYPALRLATVVAAMAFVVLFAGDLLISRSSGANAPQFIPAAAPAPAALQVPEAAPTAAPTPEAAAAKTAATEATAPVRSAAPAAGAAEQTSATGAMTESMELSVPAAIPEATAALSASQQAQLLLNATPNPAGRQLDQRALPKAEQPPQANHAEAASAIDPLHIVEIALLALVVVLGIATLVARRKQA
jgi:hypothetical protein